MKIYTLTLILLLSSIFSFGRTGNEEVLIKALLEKESSTWRSGDIRGHANCWYIRPYSKILISTADGAFIDIPPQIMIQPPAGMAGKGGTAVNSDYKFSIHQNYAWVSHNEVSSDAVGKKSFSYEIRMLEKFGGKWKLVGQSIHAYNPNN